MTSTNIASSGATIIINTRTGGKLYYLCINGGYPIIEDANSIISLSNTKGTTGTVNSVAQTVYTSNSAQINYKATLDLSKL